MKPVGALEKQLQHACEDPAVPACHWRCRTRYHALQLYPYPRGMTALISQFRILIVSNEYPEGVPGARKTLTNQYSKAFCQY